MAVYFDPNLQSLQQFLQTWPPSSTSESRVSWIYVQNAAAWDAWDASAKGSSDLLVAAWNSLCVSKNNSVSSSDLDALAVEFNIVCGKWLIFSTPATVDSDWAKVAEGVTSGLLGIGAKVSPQIPDHYNHVICVYTKNYLDVDDVKRVREGLRSVGFTKMLKYKADAFTCCDVYTNNKWGILPSRYSD